MFSVSNITELSMPFIFFVSEDGGRISSQILRQSSYYFVNKKSSGFVYFYSKLVLNDWYFEKLDHFKPSVSCDMVILFQNSPVKLNSQLTLKCFLILKYINVITFNGLQVVENMSKSSLEIMFISHISLIWSSSTIMTVSCVREVIYNGVS